MAAAGDSISRATNTGSSECTGGDCLPVSWSTGTSLAVNSHYRRLLAVNAELRDHAGNVAVAGSRMTNLEAQMKKAAALKVQYVTVLMGANDVCTPDIAGMTPTSTFRADFERAMSTFFTADPGASVFVSSLPNVARLWLLFHDDPKAAGIWQAGKICQSMLNPNNTSTDRQAVIQRESEYNSALASVCARLARCRWDEGAAYGYSFTTGDVSTVDYFHPSASGQNSLANVSWDAGFWAGASPPASSPAPPPPSPSPGSSPSPSPSAVALASPDVAASAAPATDDGVGTAALIRNLPLIALVLALVAASGGLVGAGILWDRRKLRVSRPIPRTSTPPPQPGAPKPPKTPGGGS
jgi:lysophospholipase L1-like esterase